MSLVNYATYLEEGDRIRRGDRTGTVIETRDLGVLHTHRIRWDDGRTSWVYDTDHTIAKVEKK